MRLSQFVLSAFIFISASAFARTDARFVKVRALIEQKEWSMALEELDHIDATEVDRSDLALKHFTSGVLAFRLNRFKAAKKFFDASLEKDTNLKAYSYYHLGVLALNRERLDEAEKYFDKSLEAEPTRQIRYRTRFAQSERAMAESHWKTAYKHLKYLERKWRYTPKYPEVLWRLMQTELNRKRKWQACRWARKLYSRYPSHPLVYDWGIDLQSARVQGDKLGCLASINDQKARIRRLQWAGDSNRARREIDTIEERARKVTTYHADSLLAGFLTNEGYVSEALDTLLKHYKEKQNDYDYLTLMAKAAGRAGKFQAAVGAYHKAHKLKVKSRAGRQALFRAAFLSYQFQDYDGASRKFEDFVQKYPRSGLSRDARWHLAWIRYLKGDYEGALNDLGDILESKKRNWRRWRKYSDEKIKYWMAMSHLRLNQIQEARQIFLSLAADPYMGYYSYASKSRLQTLPKLVPIRGLASETQPRSVGEEPQSLIAQASSEEEESEESLALSDEQGKSPQEIAEEIDAEGEPEKPLVITNFKDPKLVKRFARAEDLIAVGLHDWAKWELFEIESRTKNKAYLKKLMHHYTEIKSFNRSSYISQIYFSTTRSREGVGGARQLWEYAYPFAYKESVTSYSKRFGIPKELILAIMRAESLFKPDITSPVGATGLMQLMPHTSYQVAKLLGDFSFHEDQLTDPDKNIRLGARYLQRLSKRLNGLVPLVAGSYNAGPHRVGSWLISFGSLDMDEFIEHIPFLETRNYVKKVVKNYGIFQKLYGESVEGVDWLRSKIHAPVPEERPTREDWSS